MTRNNVARYDIGFAFATKGLLHAWFQFKQSVGSSVVNSGTVGPEGGDKKTCEIHQDQDYIMFFQPLILVSYVPFHTVHPKLVVKVLGFIFGSVPCGQYQIQILKGIGFHDCILGFWHGLYLDVFVFVAR